MLIFRALQFSRLAMLSAVAVGSATSSSSVSLRFRETGFCGAETAGAEKARPIQPIVSRDKAPHENPPIRRHLHDTGKSLFVWDCVVGPGVVAH
jgi:hypothetical protein